MSNFTGWEAAIVSAASNNPMTPILTMNLASIAADTVSAKMEVELETAQASKDMAKDQLRQSTVSFKIKEIKSIDQLFTEIDNLLERKQRYIELGQRATKEQNADLAKSYGRRANKVEKLIEAAEKQIEELL